MKKTILSMLALFMTAVTGAWAQVTFGVQEITADMVPSTWNGDGTIVTPQDMAGLGIDFVEVTQDQAMTWADYPTSGYVILLHTYSSSFDAVDWNGGNPAGSSSNYTRDDIYGIANNSDCKTFITVAAPAASAESIDLTTTDNLTWTLASMPAYDVELEVEYYNEVPLTDGQGVTALEDYTEQEIWVNYTRSFTEGKASTVCLPFAYTKKEGDGSFYEFTGIELDGGEYVATMTEPAATTLAANTPYLYMPSATGSVDFSGAYTIPSELTAGSYTSGDWTFKGTFETIVWDTPQTGIYGFSAQDINDIYQGEFVKVGQYVRISPMRCYLQYGDGTSDWSGVRGKNRVAAKLPETIKVRLVGADGNVTAIGSLSTTTGEMTMDGAWYSINGTRLNGTPATKGIYVRNGKKVVIK